MPTFKKSKIYEKAKDQNNADNKSEKDERYNMIEGKL